MRYFILPLIVFISNVSFGQQGVSTIQIEVGASNILDDYKPEQPGPSYTLSMERAGRPLNDRGFFGFGGLRYSSSSFSRGRYFSFSAVPGGFRLRRELGQKVRLHEAGLYGGGGYKLRKFELRLQVVGNYLVAADYRGYVNNDVEKIENFRVGLGETVDGTDRRYRVDQSRFSAQVGAKLLYEIKPGWRVGVLLEHTAFTRDFDFLSAPLCPTGMGCDELETTFDGFGSNACASGYLTVQRDLD